MSGWNCVCERTPCDGLECGVWLPGLGPRKPLAPKTPEEQAATRAKAWATRREKYGQRGHI